MILKSMNRVSENIFKEQIFPDRLIFENSNKK